MKLHAINILTIPRIVAVLLLLVCVNLWAPFHADDYFQQLLLRGDNVLQRDADASLYGLFSFIDHSLDGRQQLLRYGVLPWFADQEFYFRFFRPLAELSHQFDYWLAPESAVIAHAHSILWFVLLCAALYALMRQQFPGQPQLALLALAIFAWDGQHVATIHWIANRNALIAAFFVVLALVFFLRAQTKGKLNSGLALVFFAAALLASESAVALLIYIVLYQAVLAEGTKLKRLLPLIPFVLLLLLWQFFYRIEGFGADTAQGLYLDPLTDLPQYLWAVFQRFPVYFTASLLPMPAGLMWGGGQVLPWLAPCIITFSVVFMLWFLWRFHSLILADKRLLFWFAAGMLAVLPVCATLAQDRLSLLQTVGVDIALAMLIYRLLQEEGLNAFKRYTLLVLVIIHLLLSPLHLLAGSIYMTLTAEAIQSKALSFTDENLSGKTVVVLRMPIGESTSLVGIRQFNRQSVPEGFFWLANDEGEVTYQWLNPQQMQVTKLAGFGSGHEAAFGRKHSPSFYVSQVIQHPLADITINMLTATGLPQQITLQFNAVDAQKSLLLFDYQQGMLRRITTK